MYLQMFNDFTNTFRNIAKEVRNAKDDFLDQTKTFVSEKVEIIKNFILIIGIIMIIIYSLKLINFIYNFSKCICNCRNSRRRAPEQVEMNNQ